MADIVIEFPVTPGEEADRFGAYFQRFVDGAFITAATTDAEPNLVMLRSFPLGDRELKVLTFQDAQAALDFTRGWTANARVGRTAA